MTETTKRLNLAEVCETAWANECKKITPGDPVAPCWDAAAQAVRDAVLEEAAQVADDLANNFHEQWECSVERETGAYLDGKATGSRNVAQAIRALKDKSNDQSHQ